MLPPLQCSVALQCAHVPLANRRQLTLNRIKFNSLDHVKVTAVDRVKVKSFLERMEIRKKQSYRINASIEKSRDSSDASDTEKLVVHGGPTDVHSANKDETQPKSIKKVGGKKSPGGKQTKLPSCSLPNNMQPTFFVGGGNGVSLVEGALTAMGWKRTMDKYDERFKLKWTECKTRINYASYKEGDQMVNHIPNGNLLTNKLGLLNSLQEYERVTLSTKGRPPRLRFSDFVPETYRLDETKDKEEFLKNYDDGDMWICKPTGLNQGKGIFIIRSYDEIIKLLEERVHKKEQAQKGTKPLMTRVVQRYIRNPLLLDARKFDIRAYMLIGSTTPFLVLYHKGYVRLCCNKYDTNDTNLVTHLTNQFVQKKDPNYKDIKEDTAWSMDKFNDYINEKLKPQKNIEQDWVYNTLTKQMQKIMIHCFNSVKHKLQTRIGYFDLFGLDFMVDLDMKVWLIEVNVNPALHCNCSALKEVIPLVVEESLHISIECFEKAKRHQPLLPLNSLRGFTVLYCGTRPFYVSSRTTRSVSPVKDSSSSEKARISGPATAIARSTSPVRSHRMMTNSTPVVAAPVVTNSTTKESGPQAKLPKPPAVDEESVSLKMTHAEANSNNNNSNETTDSQDVEEDLSTAAKESAVSTTATSAKESTVSTTATSAKESAVSTTATSAKESAVSTTATSAKESTVSTTATSAKESAVSTTATSAKESTVSTNATSAKESAVFTNATSAKEPAVSTAKTVDISNKTAKTLEVPSKPAGTKPTVRSGDVKNKPVSLRTNGLVIKPTTASATKSSSSDGAKPSTTKPVETMVIVAKTVALTTTLPTLSLTTSTSANVPTQHVKSEIFTSTTSNTVDTAKSAMQIGATSSSHTWTLGDNGLQMAGPESALTTRPALLFPGIAGASASHSQGETTEAMSLGASRSTNTLLLGSGSVGPSDNMFSRSTSILSAHKRNRDKDRPDRGN